MWRSSEGQQRAVYVKIHEAAYLGYTIGGCAHLKILKKKTVREYKLKWAKKEKVDARTLDEWEVKVLDSIHTKITKISKKNVKCIFFPIEHVKTTWRISKSPLF